MNWHIMFLRQYTRRGGPGHIPAQVFRVSERLMTAWNYLVEVILPHFAAETNICFGILVSAY